MGNSALGAQDFRSPRVENRRLAGDAAAAEAGLPPMALVVEAVLWRTGAEANVDPRFVCIVLVDGEEVGRAVNFPLGPLWVAPGSAKSHLALRFTTRHDTDVTGLLCSEANPQEYDVEVAVSLAMVMRLGTPLHSSQWLGLPPLGGGVTSCDLQQAIVNAQKPEVPKVCVTLFQPGAATAGDLPAVPVLQEADLQRVSGAPTFALADAAGPASSRRWTRSGAPLMWRYQPGDGIAIKVRSAADINSSWTGNTLQHGEAFQVSQERRGPDGVRFLKIADGRGWVFDVKPGVGVMCTRCREPQNFEVPDCMRTAFPPKRQCSLPCSPIKEEKQADVEREEASPVARELPEAGLLAREALLCQSPGGVRRGQSPQGSRSALVPCGGACPTAAGTAASCAEDLRKELAEARSELTASRASEMNGLFLRQDLQDQLMRLRTELDEAHAAAAQLHSQNVTASKSSSELGVSGDQQELEAAQRKVQELTLLVEKHTYLEDDVVGMNEELEKLRGSELQLHEQLQCAHSELDELRMLREAQGYLQDDVLSMNAELETLRRKERTLGRQLDAAREELNDCRIQEEQKEKTRDLDIMSAHSELEEARKKEQSLGRELVGLRSTLREKEESHLEELTRTRQQLDEVRAVADQSTQLRDEALYASTRLEVSRQKEATLQEQVRRMQVQLEEELRGREELRLHLERQLSSLSAQAETLKQEEARREEQLRLTRTELGESQLAAEEVMQAMQDKLKDAEAAKGQMQADMHAEVALVRLDLHHAQDATEKLREVHEQELRSTRTQLEEARLHELHLKEAECDDLRHQTQCALEALRQSEQQTEEMKTAMMGLCGDLEELQGKERGQQDLLETLQDKLKEAEAAKGKLQLDLNAEVGRVRADLHYALDAKEKMRQAHEEELQSTRQHLDEARLRELDAKQEEYDELQSKVQRTVCELRESGQKTEELKSELLATTAELDALHGKGKEQQELLVQLQVKLQAAESAKDSLEADLNAEVACVRADFDRALAAAEQLRQAHQEELHTKQVEHEELQRKVNCTAGALQESERRTEELRSAMLAMTAEFDTLRSKEKEQRGHLIQLQGKLKEAEAAKDKLRVDLSAEVARVQSDLSNALDATEKLRQAQEEELQTARQQMDKHHKQELHAKEAEHGELQARVKKTLQALHESERKTEELRIAMSGMTAELDALHGKEKEQQDQLAQLQDKLLAAEAAKDKLRLDLNAEVARVRADLHQALDATEKLRKTHKDELQNTRRQLEELRMQELSSKEAEYDELQMGVKRTLDALRESEQKNDELKSVMMDMAAELEKMRGKEKQQQDQLSQLQVLRTQLVRQRDEAEAGLQRTRAELEDLRVREERLRTELEAEAQRQDHQAANNASMLEQLHESERQSANNLRQEMLTMSSQLSLLAGKEGLREERLQRAQLDLDAATEAQAQQQVQLLRTRMELDEARAESRRQQQLLEDEVARKGPLRAWSPTCSTTCSSTCSKDGEGQGALEALRESERQRQELQAQAARMAGEIAALRSADAQQEDLMLKLRADMQGARLAGEQALRNAQAQLASTERAKEQLQEVLRAELATAHAELQEAQVGGGRCVALGSDSSAVELQQLRAELQDARACSNNELMCMGSGLDDALRTKERLRQELQDVHAELRSRSQLGMEAAERQSHNTVLQGELAASRAELAQAQRAREQAVKDHEQEVRRLRVELEGTRRGGEQALWTVEDQLRQARSELEAAARGRQRMQEELQAQVRGHAVEEDLLKTTALVSPDSVLSTVLDELRLKNQWNMDLQEELKRVRSESQEAAAAEADIRRHLHEELSTFKASGRDAQSQRRFL